MLARQHKLPVGKVGIVGYAAGTGQPRIALDVGSDATYFNNPDLPQTRSEAAIPLKSRNNVIGILDVQSAQSNAFSDDDVVILQTLADQLALAIDNARLFSEISEQYQGACSRQPEVGRPGMAATSHILWIGLHL